MLIVAVMESNLWEKGLVFFSGSFKIFKKFKFCVSIYTGIKEMVIPSWKEYSFGRESVNKNPDDLPLTRSLMKGKFFRIRFFF
jgi:hypothetical protein